jgi:hypothetical protein
MKKISLRLLSFLIRRQRRQRRIQIRLSGVRHSANRRHSRISSASQSVQVVAPRHLRLYATKGVRRETESFFENVNLNLILGRSVVIDFSKLERLFPCGVLVFMGWVDEWVSMFPEKLRANYPKDDLVEQMLQHVGVLDKLGLECRKTVDHTDVKRWHFYHGKNADATQMEPFMLELQKLLGEERQLGLGTCVSEAMTNVRHHAYLSESFNSWWIFATITDRTVFMAIYDRGQSIPASLLAKPTVASLLTAKIWGEKRGDYKLIAAAVGGRTSTRLPYRGKGLPDMLDFTKNSPNSKLGIFSRNGFFHFDNHETSGKLRAPINGTLVIWTLKIPGAENG